MKTLLSPARDGVGQSSAVPSVQSGALHYGRLGGRPLRDGRYGARPLHHDRGGRATCAFTLVELLVVIVIIGILVGLLVPAVAKVRRIGHETACKAVLQAISTGLETFKGSEKLGGSYPPSFSDADPKAGGSRGLVKNPYGGNQRNISISGAGLLLWALSGADLLGTPGFSPFGTVQQWSWSAGNLQPDNDAYALYPSSDATRAGQPLHTRYGPYMEGSKVKISRNENPGGEPNFVVPEERNALGSNAPARKYPMYLDGFGYPVLYWRADLAGRGLADPDRLTPTPDTNVRGVYHWEDNAALLADSGPNGDPDTNVAPLVLNKSGEAQGLDWNQGTYGPSSPPYSGCFQGYIYDKGVQAKLWPQRADSYLLISPGYDGLYGTADDITNFEQNGK